MQTLLNRERAAIQICSELNQFVDLKNTLISVISHVKTLSNVEAVSIRLKSNGDYPYFVYNGFPDSFIRKENFLCSKNVYGEKILETNEKGHLLDCMCGNIIRGRTNPEMSFFTPKGSFWSNHTTELLKNTSDEDRQARTRNYCNSCGYESVALVPIKNKMGIIGLIQLNDKQIGKFTLELISFIEMIGEQIGLAVESALIYEDLLESKKQLEITLDELHQSQNQLIEAQKMASLGNLVAGISHEMNTPLGNALTGIHTIIDKTSKFVNGDGANSIDTYTDRFLQSNKEIAEIVLRNIEKTSSLIKSFKNTSASSQNLIKEEFNIKTFLEDIFRSISPSFKDKQIELELLGLKNNRISSYPNCIFQIITNLIMNSFIHGFEGRNKGKITIKCSRNIDSYTIQYTDDGVGILPEHLPKLFEPFYTTKKSTCTGLGLSIVYNVVTTQLKGTVQCKSTLNKGVKFIVNFPV